MRRSSVPDILTGILTRATGKTVLDYAREHLFDPLGIAIEKSLFFETKEEQMDFYKAATNSCWVCGPNKINTAGWGLTLSAREMAAIGECCIHGGQVDGKQIIPQAWLKESTRTQSCWEKRNLNYGYLWWIVEEAEPSFAALGDGGNAIYVNPQKNLSSQSRQRLYRGSKTGSTLSAVRLNRYSANNPNGLF